MFRSPPSQRSPKAGVAEEMAPSYGGHGRSGRQERKRVVAKRCNAGSISTIVGVTDIEESMVKVAILVALMAMMGLSAHAADQPLYQPAPNWVRPVPILLDMKSGGGAIDLLLLTAQNRLLPGDDEAFVEAASRVNAPEGLGQVGNLILAWNPTTESLTIHRARIIRGKQVIDLLANGRRFAVLRRETSLEAAVIDGELTATLQPEGLQVGDVIDLAFTLARHEPALAGHSEWTVQLGHGGMIGRLWVHATWPKDRSFHTWQTDDLPAFLHATHGGWAEIGLDQAEAVSPDPPKGASSFDRLFGILSIGNFKDWRDVSRTVYPLYANAATLAPGSVLRAEIARISAAHADPGSRTLAALELVESQTRYLAVGLEAGGYTPAAADLTWTRRFGDCKGKTVLLLALLHGLGIKAEPALVNTATGEGLDRSLPELAAFDHVMVRAELGNAVYWLDATRLGDESLEVLPVPNFHWALPLRPEGATLEALIPKKPTLPLIETTLRVDARGGVDKIVSVHEDVVMRGDLAWGLDLAMARASRSDGDRALRQMLTSARSWIKPDKVSFTYDPQRMEGRVALDGSGMPPFSSPGGSKTGERSWLIEGAEIGSTVDLTRTSDYHRDAPFAITYPAYVRNSVEVQLPNGGQGFGIYNGDSIDRVVAGSAYIRSAAITGGHFNMIASRRAIAENFPASDAASAQGVLRDLANYDVSIHYTPATAAIGAVTTPSQGMDSVAMGASKFFAKDYAGAEAAFSLALTAHPDATLYYNRAAVRAAMGHDASAEADLKEALRLDPKHAYALFALGRLDLARGNHSKATSWFSLAQAASDKPGSMAAMIARAYETTHHYAEAVPYWDRVAKDVASADAKARALNAACWARAEAGTEAQRALQDCDESLRLFPTANALDSRGLADIRLGDFARALADYGMALAKRPDVATSLFGRALAERRLGQTSRAEADIVDAHRIDPGIEATFAGWGLSR